MNTTTDSQFKSLRDFQDRIPGHRPGSRTHLSTLIRWATRGVIAANGERVRLRAIRLGNKWATTTEWFEEFVSRLTAAAVPPTDMPPSRTPAQRARDSAGADREAAARGY